MNGHRIFVIGASAGGVEALKALVGLLPADFPAPILVVLHISPHGTSVLPAILSRAGRLSAVHAQHGQQLAAGHIFIAPPDQHLLLRHGRLVLSRGPRENNNRPAVDVLFRSAAEVFGARTVGIVLSGVLDDGTAGLSVIKQLGGVAVAQDPADAMYTGMPQSAIDNVDVDHILPLNLIAPLMVELAGIPVGDGPALDPDEVDELEYEIELVDMEADDMSLLDEDTQRRPGVPSQYVCPECGGSLFEIVEGDVLRFRCHVGHAYSAETFLAKQSDSVEEALWVALRVLEDNMSLSRKMAERAREHGRDISATRFAERAETAESQAKIVRDVLLNGLKSLHTARDGAGGGPLWTPSRRQQEGN